VALALWRQLARDDENERAEKIGMPAAYVRDYVKHVVDRFAGKNCCAPKASKK